MTRHGTALIVPTIDAPAVVDSDADPTHVVCHGRFHLALDEAGAGAQRLRELTAGPAASAADAVATALDALGVRSGRARARRRGTAGRPSRAAGRAALRVHARTRLRRAGRRPLGQGAVRDRLPAASAVGRRGGDQRRARPAAAGDDRARGRHRVRARGHQTRRRADRDDHRVRRRLGGARALAERPCPARGRSRALRPRLRGQGLSE